MRVLQVISSLGTGGAEKFVVQLVPALRKLGVDTELLVIDRHRTIYHDELEAAGVHDARTLGLDKYYNPWSVPRMLPQIGGYDLIHSHLFPTQYWVAAAAALRTPATPLVTTEQNTTNRRRSIRFFQWLDRHVYRRYRAVVTVSPMAEEYLSGYIRSRDTRVMTIPNAIDLGRFDRVEAADLSDLPGHDPADFHVMQVSSFTAQKDQDTLVRAIAACPPRIKLLLVGEGRRKVAVRELARRAGIDDRVHFLGIRSDIPALLGAVDVAVMSSHYEGLSLAVLEAFAAGTAFVGSDVPGLGHIADLGGLKVPAEDPQALATTLTDLAARPEHRRSVARRGRELAGDYAIERIAERYRDLYAELVGSPSFSRAS